MNYIFINKDNLFDFYNLNIHNKNENIINKIILNMHNCNYKLNILFHFVVYN